MLHSGSRGVGNRIGTYFIELAKAEMRATIHLPDRDLAYLPEGTSTSTTTCEAVVGAGFARTNRELMMRAVLDGAAQGVGEAAGRSRRRHEAVNCHHNYVAREHHFGENVW
jgi:tRNA-splicing ligase RtcB (3'-phosphate/5'-hydroxy nucleic acid ligase)